MATAHATTPACKMEDRIYLFGSGEGTRRVPIRSQHDWADRADLSDRLDMRTGTRVWNSAHMMAQLLALTPNLFAGKRVLELGCGVASSSAVVSRAAAFVLATDGAAGVLSLAQHNLIANADDSLRMDDVARRRQTAVLRWGAHEDMAAARALLSDAGLSAPADSSTDKFDLVIAADCLFSRPLDADLTILHQSRALFGTAKELLRPLDGRFVTTFQARVRGMNRQLRKAAEEVGLALVFIDRKCVTGKPGPFVAAAEGCCVSVFDPHDPVFLSVRIALLAHSQESIDRLMEQEGWEVADPAEDEDDVPPPLHETLAGGLFGADDDDDGHNSSK